MFTFTIDKARIENAVRELSRLYNRSLQQVMRSQSSLFVRDCAKFTPPMTYGAEYGQSFSAQKKIGEQSVREQVGFAFTDVRTLKLWQTPNEGFGEMLHRAVQSGNVEEVNKILQRAGINRNLGAVESASLYLHEKKRNKSGRVRGGRPYMVLGSGGIDEVLRVRLNAVMTGKSGWTKAAVGLGMKPALPGFITSKGGRGIFENHLTGEKPYVVVGNAVPHVQEFGREKRIIERAMKNRVRNIEKEVAKAHEAVTKRRMAG